MTSAAELPDRALLEDLHAKASSVLETVERNSNALNTMTRRVDLIDERQQTCPARLGASWVQSHGRTTTMLASLALSVSGLVAVFEFVLWINGKVN